jgi:hypothetical protein
VRGHPWLWGIASFSHSQDGGDAGWVLAHKPRRIVTLHAVGAQQLGSAGVVAVAASAGLLDPAVDSCTVCSSTWRQILRSLQCWACGWYSNAWLLLLLVCLAYYIGSTRVYVKCKACVDAIDRAT